jgi:hypothetical protein
VLEEDSTLGEVMELLPNSAVLVVLILLHPWEALIHRIKRQVEKLLILEKGRIKYGF